MNSSTDHTQAVGMAATAGSYLIWGFLPLYWKLVQDISPGEILAHRIVWSFVFMLLILTAVGKIRQLKVDLRELLTNRKRLIGISLASVVISMNWVIYIWAVNADHVVQASLGYYINPLVSILLGILVLKEKLTIWQTVSFILAAIGVLNLTIYFGTVPWVALALAISFGIYGLIKKMVQLGAMVGLTIETLFVTPFALLFLGMTHAGGEGIFMADLNLTLILMGGGIATAVPLLLFATGAKRIPLSMVGILQYIAPTIMLMLGVFLYKEPFTDTHLASFICIWTALTLYTASKTKWFISMEHKLLPTKKSMQG
ncbi:chloramphenicol-sensitive protein RarD [Bacillus mesophilus]|uniref:EamA family transporter RarD n=1 Tax=Bacillus mesophilus TaxID=1808955 RepID=A0A6M0Q9K2_9BACI|nr:EamA family transporter RarD [Bacillus mesophilus]MBM7662376.1 chloramphenicol-sensitive protein RarD [Bacillus mesophilus]NEY72995.1 EamA family transporter RarD [Bacillus mesophilus]